PGAARSQLRLDGLAVERELAREALVERDSEREDVGPRVDGLAGELLGRGEGAAPEDEAHARVRSDRAFPDLRRGHLRDAEVDELRKLRRGVGIDDEDVCGLDVAMVDPGAMRRAERAC